MFSTSNLRFGSVAAFIPCSRPAVDRIWRGRYAWRNAKYAVERCDH